MELSTKTIDALKHGTTRMEIGDDNCIGLKIILQPTPSTSKAWAVRYKLNGSQKLTLGSYDDLSLAGARDLAVDARKLIRAGVEPAVMTKVVNAEPKTFIVARNRQATETEAIVERFATQYLAKHVRLASRVVMEPALRRVTSHWKGRPISSITRAEVKAAIAEISEKHGPAAGLKARTCLSRLFSWALEEELLDHSPATSLGRLPKATTRQRTLNDTEIRKLWKALDRVEPWLATYTKMLLLTASRRSELAALRWSEVEGTNWLLPAAKSKNHRAHLIPLVSTAMSLLDSLERTGPYVFSSDGKTHRQNFDRLKQQIDRAVDAEGGLDHWTLHDLRRSAASGMARLGVPSDHIERVLNHARDGLVATYQVYDHLSEKVAALTRWEQYLLGVVEDRPASVVTLRANERFTDDPVGEIRSADGTPIPRRRKR